MSKDRVGEEATRSTSLVIAHRLSTLRNADRILMMARGRIIEDGGHTELMGRDGHYARLHGHQLMRVGLGWGGGRLAVSS